ncbi:MAG TPA: hypothetical protein VGO14_05665 [Solirubrobacteraceae bacterium]|nr:hypothetical protein [Solirubrobacteraceae bacterium]
MSGCRRAGKDGGIHSELLPIYLNDHLAGATAALELARRLVRSNGGKDYGPPLAQLAVDIEEDRNSLLSIMAELEVGVDRVKLAAGWAAEKLGRLKLNGRLLSYSPLSRVMELELLLLGVTGKLALWRALHQLAPSEPRLERGELERLIERAERQAQELETLRQRAVSDAFGAPERT